MATTPLPATQLLDSTSLQTFIGQADGWGVKDLWGATTTEQQNLLEEVQYQGFNASHVINVFASRAGQTAKEDLAYLIMVFCVRGTNMKKILQRATLECEKKLFVLSTRYGLTRSQTLINRSDLTLGRIAAAFPAHVVACYNHYKLTSPAMELDQTNPSAMRAPGVLTCIPAACGAKNMEIASKADCEYQRQVSLVVSKNAVPDKTKISQFATLQANSDRYKDSFRVNLVNGVGIGSSTAPDAALLVKMTAMATAWDAA